MENQAFVTFKFSHSFEKYYLMMSLESEHFSVPQNHRICRRLNLLHSTFSYFWLAGQLINLNVYWSASISVNVLNQRTIELEFGLMEQFVEVQQPDGFSENFPQFSSFQLVHGCLGLDRVVLTLCSYTSACNAFSSGCHSNRYLAFAA